MRRFRNAALALLLGCCAPVIIWVVGGVALYQASSPSRKRVLRTLVCSVDTDCPPGYVCVNGSCMPEGTA